MGALKKDLVISSYQIFPLTLKCKQCTLNDNSRQRVEGSNPVVHGVPSAADQRRLQRSADGEGRLRGAQAQVRVQLQGRQVHLQLAKRGKI